MNHLNATAHTLTIFRQLFDQLPPLVPTTVANDMKDALEQLEHNPHLSLEEVEDIMIVFGKRIWPYRKAFQELYETYDGKLGEELLLQNLSHSAKKAYREFLAHGGSYADVVAGGPVGFFSSEVRVELTEILVHVQQAVWKHTKQAVLSTDREVYKQKIAEFARVQEEITHTLEQLEQLADYEQEHPELATEIRAHVRGFEFGLSALGPHTRQEDVLASVEYFEGRKRYKRLRNRR